MDRLESILVRLIDGIPGFTVTTDSGGERHHRFPTLQQAEQFYQSFGALIREARYRASTPAEGLAVNESVSLAIQPPKEE